MKTLALIKLDFSHKKENEKVVVDLIKQCYEKQVIVTIFTATLAEEIRKKLFLYYPYKEWKQIIESIRIEVFKGGFSFAYYQIQGFNRWLERHNLYAQFDCIISLEASLIQTHCKVDEDLQIKKIHESGGLSKWKPSVLFNSKLEKIAFESKQTRKIIVSSSMIKNDILRYYAVDEAKIHLLHHGIEWQELESPFLHNKKDPLHYSSLLGLSSSVCHLLFIGSHFKKRGLIPLLKALSLVKNSAFHLSIIGHDKNLSFYHFLATHFGISDKISFLSPQCKLTPFYLAADALIVPYFDSAFSYETLEALALGLFVISSQHNGGSDIIQKGCGICLEGKDLVEELKTSLETIFTHKRSFEERSLIRETVSHLSYQAQLEKLWNLCIE